MCLRSALGQLQTTDWPACNPTEPQQLPGEIESQIATGYLRPSQHLPFLIGRHYENREKDIGSSRSVVGVIIPTGAFCADASLCQVDRGSLEVIVRWRGSRGW
jgi:hypothetical protein